MTLPLSSTAMNMESKDQSPLLPMNSSSSVHSNSKSALHDSLSAIIKAGPLDSRMLDASESQRDGTRIGTLSTSQDVATPDAASLGPSLGVRRETQAPVSGKVTSPTHPNLREHELEGNGLLLQRGYEGHSYVDRSYDYMRKYPPDVKGKELDRDARAWKVYLDESESYDNDMVKAFRDTIDALLVFAALFSSVVTGFVNETSQALEPDYAKINVHLLFEQNQLLRAASNASQIDAIPKSPLGPDSVTHSDRDIWVNFMFFASLALSLATALLAILIKQWLQAFTTLIPGDAKERSLTGQFRSAGLEKWKLREIINILPLFLHLALGLFLGGLSVFVYNFHRSIRYTVISIAGTTFAFYFATVALPAIWLDCPYRQPILYIPACIAVYPFQMIRFFISQAYHFLNCCRSTRQFESLSRPSFPSSALLSREYHHVKQSIQPLEASALGWLCGQTPNISVQRIAIRSATRFLQEHVCCDDEGCKSPPGRRLAEAHLPLDALSSTALNILSSATEKLEDGEILRDFVIHASHAEPKVLFPPNRMWHYALTGPHLQLFLESGISAMDPTKYYNPDLTFRCHGVHHACRLEKWNYVKKLIPSIPKSHLIDFDSAGKTVLRYVSESNTISNEDWIAIVQLVRERNIDLNVHQVSDLGTKVLHIVCGMGKLAAVQYLLSQVDNLDCHVRDDWNRTPLHFAVQGSSPGHASIVNVLLQQGADSSACSSFGRTVLHDACWWNSSPDVIRALCPTASGKECINYRGKNGDTPILCALRDIDRWKHSEALQVIQILLSAGADLSITNNEGWIPLHTACGRIRPRHSRPPIPEVVQVLFLRTDRVKVNAFTKDGETPLDVLTRHSKKWGDEFNAISSWMREHGARLAREL